MEYKKLILLIIPLLVLSLVSAADYVVTDTIGEYETKTYTVNGFSYVIEVIAIDEGFVIFKVNDEVTEMILGGDEYNLSDGAVIAPLGFVFDYNSYVEFGFNSGTGIIPEVPEQQYDIMTSQEENEIKTYSMNGVDYTVKLVDIDEDKKLAVFKVNDEKTIPLSENESYMLSDDAVITVIRFHLDYESYVEFGLDGGDIPVVEEPVVEEPVEDCGKLISASQRHRDKCYYDLALDGNYSACYFIINDNVRGLCCDFITDVDEMNRCYDYEPPVIEEEEPIELDPLGAPNLPIDLSNYPDMFIKNNKMIAYIVVGDTAHSSDVVSSIDIVSGIQYGSGYEDPEMAATKLASEVGNPKKINIISVGTPCDNPVTYKLIGNPGPCLIGLNQGEAIIELMNYDGYAQLVVYGYSNLDTRRAARVLAELESWDLYGTKILVTGQSTTFTDTQIEVISSEIPEEPVPTEPEPSVPECNGCLRDSKCLQFGIRLVHDDEVDLYCDYDKNLKKQKEKEEPCQNNYECKTNQCNDGVCGSLTEELRETRGMLQKILDWFGKIFG